MKHYKIRIREVGRSNVIVTEHHGNLDRAGVIEFFGLNQPDVEWYEITELKDTDNEKN